MAEEVVIKNDDDETIGSTISGIIKMILIMALIAAVFGGIVWGILWLVDKGSPGSNPPPPLTNN